MHMRNDTCYIGVDDHEIDLFEGLYPVSEGVAYNSHVILDEKVAVLDTVDAKFGGRWLTRLHEALNGRQPDFLIVHHMEPDHSASISLFMETFPEAVIVASAKAFPMMQAFFGTDYARRRMVIKEGDVLCLGRHTLSFLAAPMVHWPEVMMTYDEADKTLYTADAFGAFGPRALQGDWAEHARRYYFGIVGKYGTQVQAVLQKAAALEIERICPLHGPDLTGDALRRALYLYQTWSAWQPEAAGVTIACASIYGNTARAAEYLAERLRAAGVPVRLHDLNRCDVYEAVADAFRHDRLILLSATYNADILPPMRSFLNALVMRGYHNRRVGLVENGSWAPMAAKVMRDMLASCKELTLEEPVVRLRSAMDADSQAQLDALAEALLR